MKKVILVAGASSGLGKAVAEKLAAAGNITYAGARSFAAGKPAPAGCTALTLDVTSDESAQNAVAAILAKEGRLDGLVNCAAFLTLGALEETSGDELAAVMNTNYLGMARMCRAVLPVMRKQQSGHIINFSSINGIMGIPFQGAYTASKHAIEGFSECLYQEVRRFGIFVTLVEPGDCRSGSDKYRLHAQKAEDNASPYAVWYKGAVEKIAHDEHNGMQPQVVGKAVAKLFARKAPPFRRQVAGLDQRPGVWLHRFTTGRFFNHVMMWYYRPKKKQ